MLAVYKLHESQKVLVANFFELAHKLKLRRLFLRIFPPTYGTPEFKRHYRKCLK